MNYLVKFNPTTRLDKHKINNKNLNFLLHKRFFWMREYTHNKKKKIIELGSGNGFVKKFLGKHIITSDILKNKNIDYIIDMNRPWKSQKIINNTDVFIMNHALHHSDHPINLIKYLHKNLKKNGYILINEPEISLVFKFFLKIFNHERWDTNIKNSKKKYFWRENNATGRLLFEGKSVGDKFLNYKIKANELSEFLIFLNSSGNGIDAPHIKLNKTFLNLTNLFDNLLIKIFPGIFALNRKIILQK